MAPSRWDILGPVEVFNYAARQVPGSYRIDVVGPTTNGQITMSNRLRLGVGPLPEPPPRHNTLIVAGGEARAARPLLRRSSTGSRVPRSARRTTSVCTGAYLLAAARLLDGRRATTHWKWCAGMAERYPAVEVDPDPVWVRDGDVWTSAGQRLDDFRRAFQATGAFTAMTTGRITRLQAVAFYR
jgi:transcriptional regulator GlxA family with amidase domain